MSVRGNSEVAGSNPARRAGLSRTSTNTTNRDGEETGVDHPESDGGLANLRPEMENPLPRVRVRFPGRERVTATPTQTVLAGNGGFARQRVAEMPAGQPGTGSGDAGSNPVTRTEARQSLAVLPDGVHDPSRIWCIESHPADGAGKLSVRAVAQLVESGLFRQVEVAGSSPASARESTPIRLRQVGLHGEHDPRVDGTTRGMGR